MMKESKELMFDYPRRRLLRSVIRGVGRVVLPVFFKIRIEGRENFPKSGPLIVAGNHTAVMEAAMMAVCTPWHVEILGGADVPHERTSDFFSRFYGFIPIQRGSIDRDALRYALHVLEKGGILGIFPEGGVWDPGNMKAHTGVAWLSYRGQAPVLPVWFGGMEGALGAALRLKRPPMSMTAGQLLPPAVVPPGMARKPYLEEYSALVMRKSRDLCLPEERDRAPQVVNERFELAVAVEQADGGQIGYPDELRIWHGEALAKLLHRPTLLKVFCLNLKLPTTALNDLASGPAAAEVQRACQHVLDYLKKGNPYLLSYRFGPKQGEAMQDGLWELRDLAGWVARSGLRLKVRPIRRYFSPVENQEIEQDWQESFEGWR